MKNKLVLILIASFFVVGIAIGQVMLPRTDDTITIDRECKTLYQLTQIEVSDLSCDGENCYFKIARKETPEDYAILQIKEYYRNELGEQINYTTQELKDMRNNILKQAFDCSQQREPEDKLGGGTITVNSRK